MENKYMKNYWAGYRAAKSFVFDCGIKAAIDEYTYGLNGKDCYFCRGWLKYVVKARRAAKA